MSFRKSATGRATRLMCLCACIMMHMTQSTHAAEPLPAPPPLDLSTLKPAAAVHPRLFVTTAQIATLRQTMHTTHAALWKTVQAQADALTLLPPPAYQPGGDYEQLWQRDVGNAMPTLALAYLLTNERKYLDAAKAYAMASCGYATWGLGDSDGLDLAAGHQLLGLAIVYDWCYYSLDSATRQTIHDTLLRRGNALVSGVLAGKINWGTAYLQNHQWVSEVGLTAAALALNDEPDAKTSAAQWLGFCSANMRQTFHTLGDDGASQEGVAYWEYGAEYLLKYMELSRTLMGVDYFRTEWAKHTANFPMYLSLPRTAWTPDNCIVDVADSPRKHWYGPEFILRKLAGEYHDGHAQWYAQQIDDAQVSSGKTTWLNLLWFNPKVAATPPTNLPTLHHFTDMDIVSARSSWAGDESLVVLKCGPFIGHAALHAYTIDPGGSHVHPDANHVSVFADGVWLLRDDGYRPKQTASHNTLMLDGHGQFGEGKMWFDAAPALAALSEPRVTEAVSTPALDRMGGDATLAYPAALGLMRFQRHLLFLKPDVLIVIDNLAANHVADMDVRFHPETDTAVRDGNALLMTMGNVRFRADVLTPDNVELTTETVPTPARHGEPDTPLFTVHVRRKTAQWRNATVFSWARGKSAPVVTLQQTPTQWKFTVGKRTAVFHWNVDNSPHPTSKVNAR